MRANRDSDDEMHRLSIVDDVAERLLARRKPVGDVPATHAGLAALFDSATSPATTSELSRKATVVAAAGAEVRSSLPSSQLSPSRRKSMLSKILTAKAAAAATIAALGLGTAAAAATGTLPGVTDNANSHAKAGLATASSHVSTNGSPGKPAAATNQHSQFGLCTAFLAAGKESSGAGGPATPPQYKSRVFSALISGHGGVAGTTTYCRGVVKNPPSGNDATENNSATNDNQPSSTPPVTGKPASTPPVSTGKPSSTPPVSTGKPSSTPAGSTPNSGGTSTANNASGGNSSSGTSTAGSSSNGTSGAGSGNASTHP